MRCPKCGFISFDLIESCVKCGKNIGKAAAELQGTVASVSAPVFLRMAGEEAVEEAQVSGEAEEALNLGAEGDEEIMDFSLDDEPSAEAEEVELNLEETEEVEAADIDLGDEAAGAGEAPDIDLGFDEEIAEEPQAEESIDISDLAPSEAVEEAVEGAAAGGAGQGLQDLKVEGIDLESAPEVPDSEKVMPSVKTGTALDDFDIDLGDLITSKKD